MQTNIRIWIVIHLVYSLLKKWIAIQTCYKLIFNFHFLFVFSLHLSLFLPFFLYFFSMLVRTIINPLLLCWTDAKYFDFGILVILNRDILLYNEINFLFKIRDKLKRICFYLVIGKKSQTLLNNYNEKS